MQFLAICRRRTESFDEEAFRPLLDAEAEAVRALYASGLIRSAWSREDVPGACILIEADSASEAQSSLQSLPLVAREMLEVQVIPLRGYRGFGPRV